MSNCLANEQTSWYLSEVSNQLNSACLFVNYQFRLRKMKKVTCDKTCVVFLPDMAIDIKVLRWLAKDKTNTSNLSNSVLVHGASSSRLSRAGIVPLSPERHQVDWTDVAAGDEMCEVFQKAIVSRTPPRTQTSLDGATLLSCYSHHGVQAVRRLPELACGGVLWTASCR